MNDTVNAVSRKLNAIMERFKRLGPVSLLVEGFVVTRKELVFAVAIVRLASKESSREFAKVSTL